jgi:hypothetical protein
VEKVERHELGYHTVTRDGSLIVTVTRNTQRYSDVDAIVADLQRCERLIIDVHRPSHGLIFDTRQAPSPRDPEEYERRVVPVQMRISTGWAGTAVIVRSEVGKLQVQRLSRRSPAAFTTVTTEEEARGWLKVRLNLMK